MTLIKTWSPYFHSRARMRGRTCHNQGRVTRLIAQDGEVARAQITDDAGTHTVTVGANDTGAQANVACTCDEFANGVYCEHIWATLLAVRQDPAGRLAVDIDQVQDHTVDDATPPPAPKAKKRTGDAKPVKRGEPEWIGKLSLLRPTGIAAAAMSNTESILPTEKQVCYVIKTDLSRRHKRLVIELHQRVPVQNGWSKIKRLRLSAASIAEISDPIDRELCSLIIGATWVSDEDSGERYDDRARSTYAIQSGAWRSMIARMIQTGRCMIDSSHDQPQDIRWDEQPEQGAWVLWVVGDIDEQGLCIMPEIRRGNERMSVNRPELFLGGPDGLVIYDNQAAAFDDCSAFRWITQFRDDYHWGDDPFAIRIPAADIGRFCDRLYLMPALPELDLPQGISREALHIVPDGHIEIHTGRSGSNSPRKLLHADVRFVYGETDVQPGQPGRFIQAKPRFDDEDDERHEHDAQLADDEIESEGEIGSEGAADADSDAPVDDAPQEDAVAADEHEPSPLIRRDLERERLALSRLINLGFRANTSDDNYMLSISSKQMPFTVEQLLLDGWTVTADQAAIRHPGPPRLSVNSGIDWFELHGSILFETHEGQEEVSLPDILKAAHEGRTMIQLGDGSHGLLPQEWLREHGLLTALGERFEDHLRFKMSQAALLDTLLSRQVDTQVDETFARAREQLQKFEGIKPLDPPDSFIGDLRPYQHEGLGWLDFLVRFSMGGILADDMGLGKTVQVLAALEASYRKHREDPQDTTHNPTLVVVPRSVIFNWMDEAARFTPQIRIVAYAGTERHDLREHWHEYDVIVTSYGLMRRDIEWLMEQRFEYVILDEAQAIKNPSSLSAKAARLLKANHRLALTGTPVENHLGDLWSIFEFLNPGMLGSSTRFARMIRGTSNDTPKLANGQNVIGTNGVDPGAQPAAQPSAEPGAESAAEPSDQTADEEAQVPISMPVINALRPFILRRTKREVLDDLPEKTEQTIVCEMETAQRKIYDELREHYRGTLLSRKAGISDKGLGGSTMMVLEALLRLRQAACHPSLIDAKYQSSPSAKLDTLLDSLVELIDEGHKALVFSQFTSMLAIVRKKLDEFGIKYEYLDGQTRDRRERVEHFQNDDACQVFLISLKAGGLGLNLTAADYVFILDPWWNPAVEQQAIDRAHRIGQTRHVTAYRLICQNTVEQRIAELQSRKRKLADAIVGGDRNLLSSLTRSDLEELLR